MQHFSSVCVKTKIESDAIYHRYVERLEGKQLTKEPVLPCTITSKIKTPT